MLICDEYITPASLAEAFAAMETHRGHYRVVAGCTDTLPWAREGRAGAAQTEGEQEGQEAEQPLQHRHRGQGEDHLGPGDGPACHGPDPAEPGW